MPELSTQNPRPYSHRPPPARRIAEWNANPTLFPFEVAPGEQGKTAAQLWDAAHKP